MTTVDFATLPDTIKQTICLYGLMGECPVCGEILSCGTHGECAESLRIVAVGRRNSRLGPDFMHHYATKDEQEAENS